MAFTDLLDAVGGVGRFQFLYTGLLLLPCALLACHTFLQNFTAAAPSHHCQHPSNRTEETIKDSGAWLRATIPLDQHGIPEPCQRYVEPQWALLSPNTSVPGAATEGCEDGWVYDHSIFPSTIVTEVRAGWVAWGLLPKAKTEHLLFPGSGIWCVRHAPSVTWRSPSTWLECWWGLLCLAAWQTGEPLGYEGPSHLVRTRKPQTSALMVCFFS
jgi:hypothetical protein